jgi:hypothetical protein
VPSVDGAITQVIENLGCRSRTQHIGVVDMGRPGHHGMDQGEHLATGPKAPRPAAETDGGIDEHLETEALDERGHQHQPRIGHQIRLVEGHHNAVDSARYWLHRKCLLCR